MGALIMSYAQVINTTITAVQGRPPVAARRLDTRQWVLGLRDADPAVQEACGWFQVTDTTRPADTVTERYERSVDLVAGVPTVVWSAVAKTVEEQAAEAAEAAAVIERQQARNAIANLNQYLALTSPTNAQVRQAVDYLARVCKRLIVDQYGPS